jgi:DNA-binding NtrC family response regulator
LSSEDVPTEVLPDREAACSRLVVTWSGGVVTRPLPASGTETFVVGRGEGADLVVDDTSVSRAHARFTAGDRLLVEDLGSSNGTWVDGRRLEPGAPAALRPGALVELGSVLAVVRGPEYERQKPAAAAAASGIVVRDPAMDRVYEMVDLAGRSKLSVILLGETGAGKEVIASRLHAVSPRSGGPFVKLNCASLVESLLEAELFGYERGAFTGAVQAKAGLIESADGGTVFLDEVGEMPLTTQAKLLRVLESGQVMRVGGLRPRDVDVRYVAATHRDLGKMVARGKFREDLLFRLDGLSIRIPPLRERTSEIGPLAERFIEQACRESERPPLALSDDALRVLLAHPWPGNVRELKNVIARSIVLCRSSAIGPEDLVLESARAGSVRGGSRAEPAEADASERDRIVAALAEAGGNQTRAAKILGISRRTLIYRLDELGLPRPRK